MSEFKAPEVVSTRFSCSQILCIAKQPSTTESILLKGRPFCTEPSFKRASQSLEAFESLFVRKTGAWTQRTLELYRRQTNRHLRCGGVAIETILRVCEFRRSSKSLKCVYVESHWSVEFVYDCALLLMGLRCKSVKEEFRRDRQGILNLSWQCTLYID